MTKNDSSIPNSERSRYMTWVNDRAFTSGFFLDVRATATDIGFEIEGRELVWIEKITVHAHPDAVVREYEHGAWWPTPGFTSTRSTWPSSSPAADSGACTARPPKIRRPTTARRSARD